MYDYHKLKGKMLEKGFTQESFAKSLGISVSTLSQRLNNHAEWSQDEMATALRLLDISLSEVSNYFFVGKV